eukprot:479830-Pelagomonas_calceolata.AAC.3
MDKKAHLAGGWLPLGLSSTRMTHQSSFVPTGRMWGWQDGQNCKFVEGTYGAYIQIPSEAEAKAAAEAEAKAAAEAEAKAAAEAKAEAKAQAGAGAAAEAQAEAKAAGEAVVVACILDWTY